MDRYDPVEAPGPHSRPKFLRSIRHKSLGGTSDEQALYRPSFPVYEAIPLHQCSLALLRIGGQCARRVGHPIRQIL